MSDMAVRFTAHDALACLPPGIRGTAHARNHIASRLIRIYEALEWERPLRRDEIEQRCGCNIWPYIRHLQEAGWAECDNNWWRRAR